MQHIITKEDEENDGLNALVDIAQDTSTPTSAQNDPATTISADNGEVINLGNDNAVTKEHTKE